MAKYDGFKSVELKRPTRSTFDLSHEKRMSGRIGKLMPVFISETMPNDTFNVSTEVLIKLAPMIAPIFHRLNLYVHYFFVPNRLLWEDWETFITGGRLGVEVTTPPVPPFFVIDEIMAIGQNRLDVGTLADYFGFPPMPDSSVGVWGSRNFDAMPFAAYWKIWQDYYRDRNYRSDDTFLPMPSGHNGNYASILFMRSRCWEHDYYTSALPWTQRGAEVLMPLEGGTGVNFFSRVTGLPLATDRFIVNDDLLGVGSATALNTGFEAGEFRLESSDVSINDLRRAIALQEWMERNALAGSRYSESIMAHFGRKSSDGRLQRAEYLGGGKAVIQISEVMTTAYSEDADTNVVPPGNPAGRGSAYSTTNRFSYNCEEHGFIIGILSVMPSSAYMQGIPRMFLSRNTFLDYPWPTMAHLGEQEVYDYEIFADGTSVPVGAAARQFPVFGYQSRYSDWKFIHNSSHGDFRTTLDMWHLTRTFASLPVLGETFVTFEDVLQDRIFNVSGVDTLWMYVYNKAKVKRSLPYFGTPKLV